MHAKHLSYLETSIHFNLGDNTIVRMWEQIYYEKGPQGLYERKKYKKSGKPRSFPLIVKIPPLALSKSGTGSRPLPPLSRFGSPSFAPIIDG